MKNWFIGMAALAIFGQLPQAEARYLPKWEGPAVAEMFTAPETREEVVNAQVMGELVGRKVTVHEYRAMSRELEMIAREEKLEARVAKLQEELEALKAAKPAKQTKAPAKSAAKAKR
jgi:uncharacterized small protein (DUF1192 family)